MELKGFLSADPYIVWVIKNPLQNYFAGGHVWVAPPDGRALSPRQPHDEGWGWKNLGEGGLNKCPPPQTFFTVLKFEKRKENVMVYCYGCKEEINRLDKCPKCETRGDIGFEQSREWHWLSRLWANSKGWGGDPVSLPLWFENEGPERLEEWRSFKTRLLDLDAFPLPTHLKRDYWGAFEFWGNSSGILPLQQGTLSDLISQPPIGPLVHKLASDFANYHKAQWEAEEKAEAEQRAKEEEERLKGKKKTRLVQRVGRRRKHV